MMNIISKTICLSVFSLVCPTVTSASLTSAYASLVDTSQNQTFESEPQALGLVLPGQESSPIKLAAVHFITNDNALNFGNQEFLPADLCKQGGYTHNGCPSGYLKGEECPYDSKYVKECISPDSWCKSHGYTVTSCSVPKYPANPCPYLSSLYKSCEADNIRACKEAAYSLTCEAGKIGDTAQTCPYNSSYKKCICNPCSGYAYTAAQASAQGYTPGEVCNSCGTIKYKRTENKCEGFKECTEGGTASAKICYSGNIKKFSECKEVCDSKFQYDSSNCTGGKLLTGNSCGGKYEACQSPCGNIYVYDDTNCPTSANFHCSTPCGGKYSDCKPALFTDTVLKQDGLTYVKQDTTLCPGSIKAFAGTFIQGMGPLFSIYNGTGVSLNACVTADRACYELAEKIATAKTDLNIQLTSDIYCGNLTLENYNSAQTINGNGHTITFDKPNLRDITARAGFIKINNATIISKTTYPNPVPVSAESYVCGRSSTTVRETFRENTINVSTARVLLNNVRIETENPMGEATVTTTTYIKRRAGGWASKETGIFPSAEGVMNLSGFEQASVSIRENGTLNVKSPKVYLWFHKNGVANVCSDNVILNTCEDIAGAVLNSSSRVTIPSYGSCSELKVNYVPDLCSNNIFKGDFWN